MSMKWSSEAEANIFPSWLKLRVLTGQSNLWQKEMQESIMINTYLLIFNKHTHTLRRTWRSSEHTPAPPRPTGWRGRRHFLWQSIFPWGRTWCRCSWTGERWWTEWASALDNCKQTERLFHSSWSTRCFHQVCLQLITVPLTFNSDKTQEWWEELCLPGRVFLWEPPCCVGDGSEIK